MQSDRNSIMDTYTFYDALNWLSFDDRVEYLTIADYDFENDDAPESIVRKFYDLQTMDQAIDVADAFYGHYGNVVICRCMSFGKGEFITIVDVLVDDCSTLSANNAPRLLLKAFRDLDMLYADECSSLWLCHLYCSKDLCIPTISSIKVEYEYEMMKDDHADLKEELMMVIFHPSRIQAWIEAGHDLDNYMN